MSASDPSQDRFRKCSLTAVAGRIDLARARQQNPEMHQTKKGQQWYFGMKAHIGVDECTGQVHSVVSTAANVADVTEVANLLHGKERHVFGDAGYIGAEKRAPKRGRRLPWVA